ncbi:MAG: TlyA family RNA methyltransferase [Anaerolineae bacterium]|jgi:23S rRNA (cytidine1920-2'-O)/16S rRNA (cytidine1409-2'-O)-methyltransferase
MTKVPKKRLDLLMVERGLAESRQQAQRLIMAGEVLVDDYPVDKPGTRVPVASDLRATSAPPYVGRGGLKLDAAMEAFAVDVEGQVAADVGASTGGFTDCLLQRGVARVYAIDVGYGQLAWKLRQNSRVIVMDRINARYLRELPEPVDLVTVDVSFISLKLILPAAMGWLGPGGQIVALIKPQFEAGPDRVGKGGVVRDPAVHRQVLTAITGWSDSQGLSLQGLIRSPITGAAGNVEFLAHWASGARPGVPVSAQIDACLGLE